MGPLVSHYYKRKKYPKNYTRAKKRIYIPGDSKKPHSCSHHGEKVQNHLPCPQDKEQCLWEQLGQHGLYFDKSVTDYNLPAFTIYQERLRDTGKGIVMPSFAFFPTAAAIAHVDPGEIVFRNIVLPSIELGVHGDSVYFQSPYRDRWRKSPSDGAWPPGSPSTMWPRNRR